MELRALAKWDLLYMWCPFHKSYRNKLVCRKINNNDNTWADPRWNWVRKWIVDYLLTEVLAIHLWFGYIQMQCWYFKAFKPKKNLRCRKNLSPRLILPEIIWFENSPVSLDTMTCGFSLDEDCDWHLHIVLTSLLVPIKIYLIFTNFVVND